MVMHCQQCQQNQSAPAKLPILKPELLTHPWENIGTDIFEYKTKRYLMIVDYFSRCTIVKFLSDIRSETVCNTLIENLREFGLPSTIMTSELFKSKNAKIPASKSSSSPFHHQSNSVAERSIGIVKSLWKKGEDGTSKGSAIWMHRINLSTAVLHHLSNCFLAATPNPTFFQSSIVLSTSNAENQQDANVSSDSRSKPLITTAMRLKTSAHFNLAN